MKRLISGIPNFSCAVGLVFSGFVGLAVGLDQKIQYKKFITDVVTEFKETAKDSTDGEKLKDNINLFFDNYRKLGDVPSCIIPDDAVATTADADETEDKKDDAVSTTTDKGTKKEKQKIMRFSQEYPDLYSGIISMSGKDDLEMLNQYELPLCAQLFLHAVFSTNSATGHKHSYDNNSSTMAPADRKKVVYAVAKVLREKIDTNDSLTFINDKGDESIFSLSQSSIKWLSDSNARNALRVYNGVSSVHIFGAGYGQLISSIRLEFSFAMEDLLTVESMKCVNENDENYAMVVDVVESYEAGGVVNQSTRAKRKKHDSNESTGEVENVLVVECSFNKIADICKACMFKSMDIDDHLVKKDLDAKEKKDLLEKKQILDDLTEGLFISSVTNRLLKVAIGDDEAKKGSPTVSYIGGDSALKLAIIGEEEKQEDRLSIVEMGNKLRDILKHMYHTFGGLQITANNIADINDIIANSQNPYKTKTAATILDLGMDDSMKMAKDLMLMSTTLQLVREIKEPLKAEDTTDIKIGTIVRKRVIAEKFEIFARSFCALGKVNLSKLEVKLLDDVLTVDEKALFVRMSTISSSMQSILTSMLIHESEAPLLGYTDSVEQQNMVTISCKKVVANELKKQDVSQIYNTATIELYENRVDFSHSLYEVEYVNWLLSEIIKLDTTSSKDESSEDESSEDESSGAKSSKATLSKTSKSSKLDHLIRGVIIIARENHLFGQIPH